MRKILVSGATGFIGNYVIRELLNRGYQVIATSRDETKASSANWFGEVDYIPFDLSLAKTGMNYFDFFGKPDLLIHLAWSGLPNYKSDIHLEVNLPEQYSFLHNLLENGLRDLTVTGTCFEYGMQEGELKETTKADPQNSYALAKDQLRKKLEILARVHNFSLKWVRLFYMYGKGQNAKSLLSQLENSLSAGDTVFNMSGGKQIRDFLPVTHVASYIVDIALQNEVQGIINCSSGVPVTVKDFVEEYLKKNNKSISLNLGYYPYPDYEPMSFWGNTDKLNKIIHHE